MGSKTRLVVIAAVLTQLWGCSSVPDAVNPISWYRDVTGASKNDELGKGQNEQNLKEGSNEPYPNLGSVPDAPENALSAIDRDKLVDSLIADRNNAKYADDDLRAGRPSTAAPPPPPPAPPSPPVAAVPAPPASPAPAARPLAPEAPQPPAPPAAPPAPHRVPARGSESPPAESSLQTPTVSSLPQGETVTPAPPPPEIPPPNAVANAASAGAAAHLKPPSARGKEPVPAASAADVTSHGAAVSYHVADLSFAPGSALLSDKLRDTVATIVKLHKENGGTIRIVGHGEAVGANAATTGLKLALDRAQAVAVALSESGVPAKEISVEAAPVAASGGRDVPRAEVYLEN